MFTWIERRLTLPGDSETRRSQKLITTLLMFAGGAMTLLNVYTYLSAGLAATAAIYLGWTIFVVSAAALILVFPRWWQPIFSIALVAVVPMVVITQVRSGGYQSGLETAVWLLQVPIAAALFLGSRYTIFGMFLYAGGVIMAALLEPYARLVAPEMALQTRMQIAAGNMIMMGLVAAAGCLYLLRQVEYYRRRADELLLNMLPAPIAARLKVSPDTIADSFEAVSVLFADIVGSTPLFAGLQPVEVVDWLNEVFSVFDQLVEKYGLEKIRTMGDGYMVASGAPIPRADHAQALAGFALEMIASLDEIPARQGKRLIFRVGIHSGPVVAGVIGRARFHYDLWGDTANVASRMESQGVPGQIQISQTTYELLKDEFTCQSRGRIDVKGKGEMETWFLQGVKGT